MKTIIFFTTLLIFLHTTTYHLIGTEAKVGLPDPLLDEDGNPLLGQYIYYVLPTMLGPGGLISCRLGNKNCRYGVSQELLGDGLPVGFSQPNMIPGGVVRESTDTNIMFPGPIGCNSSGVWKVDEYDEPSGQYFIVTDGVAGNPGDETVNNWFRIERVVDNPDKYHYKFVYSPEVCPKCIKMDNNIDFFSDGPGMGFLALAETSYVFKFRRFVHEHERY